MKKMIFLLTILSMLSCASPQYFYDYDRSISFSDYTSYNFYPSMKTNLSDLDAKRVKTAIDSVLQHQGYTKSNTPDFKINFYASYFSTPSQNQIGIGIGSGGGNVGVGISGGIPIGGPQTYMNLTVEFVEYPSNILFWQGVVEAKFYPRMAPKERSHYYYTLIKNLLANYPPKVNQE